MTFSAKKTGDYVAMDELLCELESDKATFELNSIDKNENSDAWIFISK